MGALKLRSRWLRATLIASAALIVLAFPVAANDHLIVGEQGVVSNTNGSGLNIRTEPSLDSQVNFIADEGTPLEVVSGPDESGGYTWYGVHIDGINAWAMADYVVRMPSQVGGQLEVVNTDGHGLRLRSEASLDSETLTVMSEGAVLNVVGEEQTDASGTSWANVQYNGQTGYSHRGYLSVVSGDGGSGSGESEPASNPEPETVSEPETSPEPVQADTNGISVGGNAQIVNTSGHGLNVRHGAGYGNSVVTVAAEGDVVRVLDGPQVDGDGTNWWNVDYKGLSGWVHGGYVQGTDQEVTQPGSATGASSSSNGESSAPSSSPIGEQIVNEAMRFLGYPYVWGGTTPSGFDCSGFLYYVVNQVSGNGFPRVLESQVNRGTHVPADQLQPGDLVFQQNTYQWGLSHAGIYIGNGQFIHASTPGSGVVISNLWDSYWGQRYYTARRVS